MSRILLLCLFAVVVVTNLGGKTANGFVLPPKNNRIVSTTSVHYSPITTTSPSPTSPTGAMMSREEDTNNTNNVDEMKRDIAQMREEAIERLDVLNEKLHEAEEVWHQNSQHQSQLKDDLLVLQVQPAPQDETNTPPAVVVARHQEAEQPQQRQQPQRHIPQDASAFDEAAEVTALITARMERESIHHQVKEQLALEKATSAAAPIKLLDDTRWRLMLNIGREPGTWMPKTWGVSGERVFLNLELEFTPDQLFEREDFLSGVSGAKVLRVVQSQATLSPTLQEGGRRVRVQSTGGWRVAPGEGPMGTSVLRFYFELEEETRHQGSDVYCPAGRIYCTCGYFPMSKSRNDGTSLKVSLRNELHEIEAQYERLTNANDMDNNLVSWEKVQRAKEMMDLRIHASKIHQKFSQAQVREPEKSLLRMSQDQTVGITREGGVCCKVQKGLAIEYHILGKFEVASMENREHSDYRRLLP